MKILITKLAITFGFVLGLYLFLNSIFHPEPTTEMIAAAVQAKLFFLHFKLSNLGRSDTILPLAIFIPNILLIVPAVYLFAASLSKTSKQFFVILVLFSLSPFIWQAVFSSAVQAVIIFLSCLYLYLRKTQYRLLPLILLIFYTPLSWLISIFLVLFDKSDKIKSSIPLVLIPLALLISIYISKDKLVDWFSPLNPQSYRFENDIHRQSELNAKVPILGKILYNKYLSTPGIILKNSASILDWDRAFFIAHSGKSENRPFDKPQFTWLELPIIIIAILRSKRSALKILALLLIASLSATVIRSSVDQSTFVWLILSVVIFSQLPNLKFLFLSFFLLGRIIYLNLDMQNNLGYPRTLSAYIEVLEDLQKYPDQKIFFTDRLGQPHLYLTYLGAISPDDLASSLSTTLAVSLPKIYLKL